MAWPSNFRSLMVDLYDEVASELSAANKGLPLLEPTIDLTKYDPIRISEAQNVSSSVNFIPSVDVIETKATIEIAAQTMKSMPLETVQILEAPLIFSDLTSGISDLVDGQSTINNADMTSLSGSPSATTREIADNSAIFSDHGNDANLDNEFTSRTGDLLLYASDEGDKLVGAAGNDKLIGGEGQDELIGGNGNDLLFGGASADQLWGGNGDDVIKAGTGNDTASGNDGADLIFLGDGIDTAYGGAGDDEIYGDAGDDFIHGDAGADRLSGGEGHDDLRGGDGHDTLSGESGNDYLYGEGGDDILYGNEGHDRLDGGDGNDTLSGDAGNDTLNGHDGNDILYGGAGEDIMEGHHGDDRLEGGDDADILYGQDGSDILRGDGGNDILYGGHGNDDIQGGFGADTIYGGDDNDIIHLGEGADIVSGGRGADRITAWDGDGARDVFVYTDGDSGPTDLERDVIIGFTSGEDMMDFTALGPLSFTNFGFLGNGQASFYFDGDIIQIDRDTDGFADMSIEMQYVDAMSVDDFMLV